MILTSGSLYGFASCSCSTLSVNNGVNLQKPSYPESKQCQLQPRSCWITPTPSPHVTTVESGMARLSKWLLKCLCAIVALQISSVTGQSGDEATIEEGEVTKLLHYFSPVHLFHYHKGDYVRRRRIYHSVWRLLLL